MFGIKKILVTILGIFIISTVAAQTRQVTGHIENRDGEKLPGVVITNISSGDYCVSLPDGTFTIKVNSLSDTIKTKLIGYIEQIIPLKQSTEITIVLEEEDFEFKEVVITALGIKRDKKSLGYSVSELAADDISKAQEINIINSLSGRVAGLSVSATNGSPLSSSRIVLRGNNSFNDNQALIVVNGVPVNNNTISNATDEWGGKDYGSGISDINPEDIESVSVLKGAGAAALYGARAANGVILINTKNGANKGIAINFNSSFSLETADIRKKFQNIYGAGSNGKFETHWELNQDGIPVYKSDKASHYSSWGPAMTGQDVIYADGKISKFLPHADNYKNYFRTGTTINNSLSISGGASKHSLRFTFSDLRNKDIVPSADNRKNNLSLNFSTSVFDKLQINGFVSYINQRADNRPSLADEHTNSARNYIQMPRDFSAELLENIAEDENGKERTWFSSWNWMTNPYWNDRYELSFDKKNRIFGDLSARYNFNEKLSLMLRTSADYGVTRFEDIAASFGMVHPTGYFGYRDLEHYQYNHDFLLSYDILKGETDYEISANIGGNAYYENSFEKSGNTVNGLKTPKVYNIENSAGIPIYREYLYEKAVNSLYYTSKFSYKNMLFLDITGRNDWSSTLAKKNNSFFYDSYNLSFVFTELIPKNEVLSFGKIRLSFARVGNDTRAYQTNLTYYTDTTDVYGSYTHINKQIPPLDLKPEKMQSFEFGGMMQFFKGRIKLDISAYRSNTFNQIMGVNVSASSGAVTALINAGNIQNTGLEIQTNFTPIETKKLRWQFTINFAKNKSSVIELTDGVDNHLLLEHWGLSIEARPGHPYGDIVGYGIKRDEQGNKLVNANGLYMRTEEPVVLGNINPDFTASFSNSLEYDNFAFSFLIDAKIGGEMFSGTNMYGNGYAGNFTESLEGRKEWYESELAREQAGVSPENWTPTGGYLADGVFAQGTIIKGEDVSGQANSVYVNPFEYWHQFADWTNEIHEPFVYDASFIKLREVSLSYRFDNAGLNKFFIKNIILSLYGRNLWLIHSNVPNVDAESFHTNGNGQGYELYAYPNRRSVGLKLSLNFK